MWKDSLLVGFIAHCLSFEYHITQNEESITFLFSFIFSNIILEIELWSHFSNNLSKCEFIFLKVVNLLGELGTYGTSVLLSVPFTLWVQASLTMPLFTYSLDILLFHWEWCSISLSLNIGVTVAVVSRGGTVKMYI